jgi:hypothetical protein
MTKSAENSLDLSIDCLKEGCTAMYLWINETCQFAIYPDFLKPVAIRHKKY